jgi:Methyltransferase domain
MDQIVGQPIDAERLDPTAFQVIDDAVRHPQLATGRRDPGKVARVPPDEVGLDRRPITLRKQGLELWLGVEHLLAKGPDHGLDRRAALGRLARPDDLDADIVSKVLGEWSAGDQLLDVGLHRGAPMLYHGHTGVPLSAWPREAGSPYCFLAPCQVRRVPRGGRPATLSHARRAPPHRSRASSLGRGLFRRSRLRAGRAKRLGCACNRRRRGGHRCLERRDRPCHQARPRVGPADRACFEIDDITSSGLPESSFDGAMSVDVLWAVPDKARALRETARILKPGAQVPVHQPRRRITPSLRRLS